MCGRSLLVETSEGLEVVYKREGMKDLETMKIWSEWNMVFIRLV